jgi:hypothetical protein
MNNEAYKNIIIIPKHLFSKFQNFINDEKQMTFLDQEMHKVMKLKNVDDDKKWNLYKHNLFQYELLRKKNNILNNIHNNSADTFSNNKLIQIKNDKINKKQLLQTENNINKSIDITSDIDREFKNKKEYPFHKTYYDDNDIENALHNKRNEYFFADENKMEIDTKLNEMFLHRNNQFFNEDLEFELHKQAQKELGTKNENDVIRRNDSLGSDYRIFEDRKSGAEVRIPVEPIMERLYNEPTLDDLNYSMERPSPVKKKRAHKPSVSQFHYNTRQFIKNNASSKEFLTQELHRKSGIRDLPWEIYK